MGVPGYAIWGSLEANLKKSTTLKFMTNISFLPLIYIHRSIVLIFIEKKYACQCFFHRKIFFCDFQFSLPQESPFPRQIPGSEQRKERRKANKSPLTLLEEDSRRWSCGRMWHKISMAFSACSLQHSQMCAKHVKTPCRHIFSFNA